MNGTLECVRWSQRPRADCNEGGAAALQNSLLKICFTSLPLEILLLVSDYLTESDLNSLAKTNRHLYTVFNPVLWNSARDNEHVRCVGDHPCAGILRAAAKGNLAAVRKFLGMGVDVNLRDPVDGITSLVTAVHQRHAQVVELLLSNGATMRATCPADSVLVSAFCAPNSKALIEVLSRYELPISEFEHSRNSWTPFKSSCLTRIRKHFLSMILAEYKTPNNPNSDYYAQFVPDLILFAIYEQDVADVQYLVQTTERRHFIDRMEELFTAAVELGNEDIVRILLDAGADSNMRVDGYPHLSVMYLALLHRHRNIARLLHEHGALLGSPSDVVDSQIPSVVGAAASRDLAMFDFVLEMGAEVQVTGAILYHVLVLDPSGPRYRHLLPKRKPVSIEILDRLLDLGADPNELLPDFCPLKFAIETDWMDGLRFLLQHGANPNGPTGLESAAPLYEATSRNCVEAMELLLHHGANPNGIDSAYRPLYFAKSAESALLLLKYGASIGKNDPVLHAAAGRGDLELVNVLLEAGASAAAFDDMCDQPLHRALRAKKPSPAVIDTLLRHGAPIDLKVLCSLRLAVKKSQLEVVRVLLDHGANIHNANRKGHNALHFSCIFPSTDVARLLLDHGADVTRTARDGSTALHFAVETSPEIVALLLNYNAPINARKDGRTALQLATEMGKWEAASILLSGGASPSIPNKRAETPLHHAVAQGHVETVKSLLQHGASVSAQDKDGLTPLAWAILGKCKDTARLLLEHGGDMGSADYLRVVALDFARSTGDERIIEMMQKAVAGAAHTKS
ncbi:hypothetical protein VTO42DRAFT_2508 [Malbranchea cinnamomea]